MPANSRSSYRNNNTPSNRNNNRGFRPALSSASMVDAKLDRTGRFPVPLAMVKRLLTGEMFTSPRGAGSESERSTRHYILGERRPQAAGRVTMMPMPPEPIRSRTL